MVGKWVTPPSTPEWALRPAAVEPNWSVVAAGNHCGSGPGRAAPDKSYALNRYKVHDLPAQAQYDRAGRQPSKFRLDAA
jgi:hypothetical protein